MEYRDLYDAKRNLTGKTIQKGEDIPEDYYILIVVVFIQNHKGEFLMQKRSERKGGKWATTGGHPKAGETSLEGIQTEVQEELGIHLENPICFKQVTKDYSELNSRIEELNKKVFPSTERTSTISSGAS